MRLGSYYRIEVLRRLRLAPPPGARVLDIGCHDGVVLHHLGGALRVGVDIRPDRRYPIHYVRGDGCRLPFRQGSFDWIYALEVIEHVREREDLVASAIGALRGGGTLVLSVPHRGMTIFPASLTGLVHRMWGHDPGFRGVAADEIEALLPRDLIAGVRFVRWRGRAFTRGFLPLRLAWGLSRSVGRRWARSAAKRDARRPAGGEGAYLLFAIIRKA